jgi:hypothetical protein
MGGKKDGERIATCEEYSIKRNKWKKSKMTLTTPKSGFGSIFHKSLLQISIFNTF